MGRHRSGRGLVVAVLLGMLLGAPATRAAAQGAAPGGLASKTVHGKLEMVNESVNGVAVVSDDGQRMAWQFDKAVIARLKDFKAGDPVVVIYRLRGTDKAVTAIGFPGAADTPVYVNLTGQRVALVSGPDGERDLWPAGRRACPRDEHPVGWAGRDLGRLLVLCARGQELHPGQQDGPRTGFPDALLRVTG